MYLILILYDKNIDRRFLMVMINSEGCQYDCYIDLGISSSNDPTSAWRIYNIPYGNVMPDQPKLGISEDKMIIGTSLFDNVAGFMGSQFIVIEKNRTIIDPNTL